MVSDFFFPNCGGVENHIYQLSQCLMRLGHKVVVISHAYGDCCGVRYLSNGLKVYYLYRTPVYLQSTLPTLLGPMHMLRLIAVREGATLLHAHQAFSTLGLEAALCGCTMGLPVVFTDHSLFGFADAASIVMNKLLKFILADVHHVICVSHTSKENTVLRACLPPSRVSVIPNAVNAVDFLPAGMPSNATGEASDGGGGGGGGRDGSGGGGGSGRGHSGSGRGGSGSGGGGSRGSGGGGSCGSGGRQHSGLHSGQQQQSGQQRRQQNGQQQQRQQQQQQQSEQRKQQSEQRQQSEQQQQQQLRAPFASAPAWPRDPMRDPVTIVSLSRLVYRKGIDLLALVIPVVCAAHPNVRFIVGGDGPKRALLQATVEQHGLQERVTLVGEVPPEKARDFLVQGHIFLNASLTEAFCMAIVEAASVGLRVVSTRVGGVPEVLPPDMVVLADPSAEGLIAALETTLLQLPAADTHAQHARVASMYSWQAVAQRTIAAYGAALSTRRDGSLLARLRRYAACGLFGGPVFAAVAVAAHMLWRTLRWLRPESSIPRAPDWPRRREWPRANAEAEQ
ncbi:hypothetical protein FOA52_003259 [Chlamydomonas sp. UWO 241]|nr:hypothetical protein FOA52_003259 [Chlamydomonas sp. UWO 241]